MSEWRETNWKIGMTTMFWKHRPVNSSMIKRNICSIICNWQWVEYMSSFYYGSTSQLTVFSVVQRSILTWRSTYLGLLPVLRLVLSGAWSHFSGGISEVEADDDWDDTDSLLLSDVSSAVRQEPSPTVDTKEKKKKKAAFIKICNIMNSMFTLILC